MSPDDATSRPLASVSLDVDNLWSYQKTHGDAGWESRPSYLDIFLPHALDALDELGLRITFFLVGIDAEQPANGASLRAVTARGHEVGNHSFEHEPWLHLYDRSRLEAEIGRAEDSIAEATGERPIGFRGPGYSWSPALLEVLAARGYLYDASTLPTYLGPFARTYYFWNAHLSAAQKAERASLFGSFGDGLRPLKPYRWQLDSGSMLLEIPVTTFPGIKTPFHLSYLLFLSRFSEELMVGYLRTALAACRLTGIEPSFLLHPLDLLGGDQVPQLAFFPGMDLTGRRKVELFHRVLRVLGEHYTLVNMSTHARSLLARPRLRTLVPAATAVAGVPSALG
ncbi:MAG: polysaccharide deacetylase family protein [Gemmatimonadota bacterium]